MVLSKNDISAALAGTSLDLVFGSDVRLMGGSRTVDEAERDTESDTHRELRKGLVLFCERLGIGIYPNNIGRRGLLVMADALLWRAGRKPLFIEIVGSEQALDPANIDRKRSLASAQAPLRFLMTGFEFDRLVGVGSEPGWGGGFEQRDKSDFLYSGIPESRLTTRGTTRKKRGWILAPTMHPFLRAHFGFPPFEPKRPKGR
jgi:hypothetical protein